MRKKELELRAIAAETKEEIAKKETEKIKEEYDALKFKNFVRDDRVSNLEKKAKALEEENNHLRHVIDNMQGMPVLQENGCAIGAWCEACKHNVTGRVKDLLGRTVGVKDVCSFGKCENFEHR